MRSTVTDSLAVSSRTPGIDPRGVKLAPPSPVIST